MDWWADYIRGGGGEDEILSAKQLLLLLEGEGFGALMIDCNPILKATNVCVEFIFWVGLPNLVMEGRWSVRKSTEWAKKKLYRK
jgi:hypothetical protein